MKKRLGKVLFVLVSVFVIACVIFWIAGSRIGARESQLLDNSHFSSVQDLQQFCENTSSWGFVSGLFFNPQGVRQYYIKSQCFQKLAVRSRNPEICHKVRERFSIFLDGSKVSASHCLKTVEEVKSRFADEPPDYLWW